MFWNDLEFLLVGLVFPPKDFYLAQLFSIQFDETIFRCVLSRPKSSSHSVILTHVLYTLWEEFLIDDDMIPYLCTTKIRNHVIVYQRLLLYCA